MSHLDTIFFRVDTIHYKIWYHTQSPLVAYRTRYASVNFNLGTIHFQIRHRIARTWYPMLLDIAPNFSDMPGKRIISDFKFQIQGFGRGLLRRPGYVGTRHSEGSYR